MMMAIMLAPVIAVAQTNDVDPNSRHVVILNATDPYLPAFVEMARGLRESIRLREGANTNLYEETLDWYRFPQQRLKQDMATLLQNKYQDLTVDVVVAITPVALGFVQRYGAEIWPGAGIVFNSIPSAMLSDLKIDAVTIGIPVRLEFDTTIDLALRLRPKTRHIAVIAGTSAPERRNLALARASLVRYQDRYQLHYLDGLTLADTIAAVQALPEDTIVLYLALFRDGAGTPMVPREVLAQLAAVSKSPIFGLFSTYIGSGAVAGSITTYHSQGQKTGELIVRLLNGEDPAEIGVQAPVEPTCIADWQQLQRWNIDAALLPEGCEIRFETTTVWAEYRWYIVSALILILLQTALIATLVRTRNALLDEADRHRQTERMVMKLRERLARFSKERSLGAMATSISHEINQPLMAIQNYAQAAGKRLQSGIDETPKLIELFAKIEGQAERAGNITRHVRALVNKSDVQLRPLAPGPLVKEVIGMMAPEIEEHGCDVECVLADDLPEVLGESLELQLVLVNLLHNAIQSICSTGDCDKRITVEVLPVGVREVQFSVIDWGSGVAPDQVADLFEPLSSETHDGMGMGLAIAHTIIEAHGGRLWYQPNPDGGAIFHFTVKSRGS